MDLENLLVTVHAMKSSLATIGATTLPDVATRLEAALRNKDIDYFLGHFPTFKQNLISLYERLSTAFPDKGTPS